MKAQLSWLKRLLLDQVFLLIVICIIGLFTPWNQLLKSAEEILLAIREQAQVAPIPTAIGYVLSFIGMTAISFPGPMALLMAVFGGWLFGWYAIPLSSFSSSTGACLAFLSSRYFLSDSTLFRYFPALQRFNQDRSHATWIVLLSCRLEPLDSLCPREPLLRQNPDSPLAILDRHCRRDAARHHSLRDDRSPTGQG